MDKTWQSVIETVECRLWCHCCVNYCTVSSPEKKILQITKFAPLRETIQWTLHAITHWLVSFCHSFASIPIQLAILLWLLATTLQCCKNSSFHDAIVWKTELRTFVGVFFRANLGKIPKTIWLIHDANMSKFSVSRDDQRTKQFQEL